MKHNWNFFQNESADEEKKALLPVLVIPLVVIVLMIVIVLADYGKKRTEEPAAVTETAETQEQEVEIAWEDARKYFNRCHKCGKWVSNAMYNADVAECVECAPWENFPRYCAYCGKEITSAGIFCPRCGKRLQYGGDGS